ncbi:MAG: hypothetical protein IKS22_13695 [Bacteroidales bacterium]|nr:hypothetical protein [Bacteroidales bacterium]
MDLIPEEVKENSFDCRGIWKVTFPGGMIPVDFLKNVSRNIASVEENPDKILIMGTSGEKITLTCCNDGFRPVFFKLEVTDEEAGPFFGKEA